MKSYRHDAAGAGHWDSERTDAQWALRKPELAKLREALENSWELGRFGKVRQVHTFHSSFPPALLTSIAIN